MTRTWQDWPKPRMQQKRGKKTKIKYDYVITYLLLILIIHILFKIFDK
jgi:hypothetical protein